MFGEVQKIKISVIIPIYNMEKYLKECLDSALAQTLQEIELICINDGSSDGSLEILKQYALQNAKIVIINQINQGVAAARNAGLEKASGEFVCFMDPDDWYPDNDILATLYEKAVANNVYICGGSFSEYLPDGRVVIDFVGSKKKYKFENEELMFYKYYQFDYGYHRFIYNREFLKKNEIIFPPYLRFQDPPFFVKAMVSARKFYALTKITYAYRVGHQNVQWTERKLSDLLKGLTDNLRYSRIHQLAELHQTTVRRMATTYKMMYVNAVFGTSAQLIELLVKFHSEIDESLLTAKDTEYGYGNIIKDILLEAGIFDTSFLQSKNVIQIQKGQFLKTITLKGAQKQNFADNVKVSVIVPVYNVEEYLTECLETLVDQTLKEIEIICVNDGSKDQSKEIIEAFINLDKRIVLLDKDNGGLSSARNAGLEIAQGKYIYFIDSDDYLEQNALEELYEIAEREQLDIVYFNAVPLFESEEGAERHKYYSTYYVRNEDYYTPMLGSELYAKLEENGDFRPSACLQFLRRNFLKDVNVCFYEGILHEDNLFTITTLIQAKKAKHIKNNYYHRRLREGSIMTIPKTMRNVHGYFVTLIELLRFMHEKDISDETLSALRMRLRAIEYLIFDIYDYSDKKDTDELFSDNMTLHMLFKIIVENPYELVVADRQKRMIGSCSQISDLNNRIDELQYQFDCMRNSFSFRVGRIITCVPRKVRTFVKYWNNGGIKAIMELISAKVK